MPPKKEEKKTDYFVEIMFVLLILGILALLWSNILRTIFDGASYASIWQAIAAWFLAYIWPIVIVLGIILSVSAIVGIIYNLKKLNEVAAEEKKIYGPTPKEEVQAVGPVVVKNEKWEQVQSHIHSSNPSDWRLAIIDADVMLEEALRAEGYHGETLGDLLKGVDKSEMRSLDDAWEAHKVRNQIAHGGAGYQLAERDALRTISLYASVFTELQII